MESLPEDLCTYIVLYIGRLPIFNKFSHKYNLNNYLYKLKGFYSKKYYDGEIELKAKRISLDLSYTDITDVSMLGHLEELYLKDCRNLEDVSALGNLKKLNVMCCENITDVSALSKVKKLVLRGCSKIRDVSMLKDVEELDIRWIELEDMSMLGSVGILYLSCSTLTDVSPFVNLQELTLSCCHNVIDVTMLGNLKKLHLHEFPFCMYRNKLY